MKKLTLIAFALALTASAQTTTKTTSHSNSFTTTSTSSGGGTSYSSSSDDVKDDLFAGTEAFAKNATNATEITMGPDGLGMAAGYGKHGAHNMVLNVVRSYTFDKPGMYNMAEVDAYRAKVNTGDWHCSVHTRDLKTGESTDVCNKHRTDGMIESAIITVEPKELTFIHTIRKGGDDKSENGSDVSYFGGGLPIYAMVNEGKLAAMQAQLQANAAVWQARNGMYAAMDAPLSIRLDKGTPKTILLKKKPGPASEDDKSFFLAMPAKDAPKQDFMVITPDEPKPGDALGDIKLEMKRDAEKPKSSFMIVTPDEPAPAAPAPTPAPAAPQQ